MQRLIPDPSPSVDVAAAYAPTPVPDGDAFVRLNMIESLDGAISVNGRSGALGGPPDKKVFATLRAWTDVIVVGAGTMRAENYGPARLDDEAQRVRRDRGQSPQPPIAVVSRAANFDFTAPFFTDAVVKPILVTTVEQVDDVMTRAGDVADALGAGSGAVDLRGVIAQLVTRGLRNVLVEGGPGLNSDLAREGLLDEICLTLSPRIVGGDGPRIIAGPPLMPPYEPRLLHLLEEDGFLFRRMALRA
jgi:riboflavin biosynthesis pyrimidine reductase